MHLASLDGLAVTGVENAANGSAIGPWKVRDGVLNLVVAVGKGDEHFSSGESIEVVHNILLI